MVRYTIETSYFVTIQTSSKDIQCRCRYWGYARMRHFFWEHTSMQIVIISIHTSLYVHIYLLQYIITDTSCNIPVGLLRLTNSSCYSRFPNNMQSFKNRHHIYKYSINNFRLISNWQSHDIELLSTFIETATNRICDMSNIISYYSSISPHPRYQLIFFFLTILVLLVGPSRIYIIIPNMPSTLIMIFGPWLFRLSTQLSLQFQVVLCKSLIYNALPLS